MGISLEITDMVIDQLQDETQLLMTCSLVHSNWRNRSQLHLFRHLSVSSMTRYEQFVSDFISTQKSCNLSHLCSYIREISLTEGYDDGKNGSFCIRASEFPRIFASLPSLRRLHIGDVAVTLDHAFNPLDTPLVTLDRLELIDVIVFNEADDEQPVLHWILPFLSTFSSIDSLSISFSTEDVNNDSETPVPSKFPSISSIHMEMDTPGLLRSFLQDLCRLGAGKYLGSINMLCSTWEDPVWLTKLLSIDSPALKHLVIDLQDLHRDSNPTRNPLSSLTTCTNLSMVEIRVTISNWQAEDLDWNAMISLLKGLPQNSLECLRLGLYVCDEDGSPERVEELIQAMDWEPIDNAISILGPSLRQVLFQYKTDSEEIFSDNLWSLTTREVVPSVYQRGVLAAR